VKRLLKAVTNTVTEQLADTPTSKYLQLADCQLALLSLRTAQVGDWTSHRLGKLQFNQLTDDTVNSSCSLYYYVSVGIRKITKCSAKHIFLFSPLPCAHEVDDAIDDKKLISRT